MVQFNSYRLYQKKTLIGVTGVRCFRKANNNRKAEKARTRFAVEGRHIAKEHFFFILPRPNKSRSSPNGVGKGYKGRFKGC